MTERCAVVTGGNKGIGLEICRQLAAQGVCVVVTARNEKRGLEALEKLTNTYQLPRHLLFFHQLDVANPATISALSDYLKNQFGKIDILVNNAAIGGAEVSEEDVSKIRATAASRGLKEAFEVWRNVATQNLELTKECIETNYYGAKRTCEALIPLLSLSDSPRIVNVSSRSAKLEEIPSEEIRERLRDENLSEEGVDKLVDELLKDFEEGSLESKGWPVDFCGYRISKAAMNAYTKIIAKKLKQPKWKWCVNCVCPGSVPTDITFNIGLLTVEQGAAAPVKLALLPSAGGPTGLFFIDGQATSF